MGFGTNVETVERPTASTPLAEDFVAQLQGFLSEGAFAPGPGPQQRRAGTAIEQFITSLQDRGRPATAPQVQDHTGRLISALESGSARRADRQSADLREGFGAGGARFGTSAAAGEGILRGDIASMLDQNIGQILMQQGAQEQQARQFDIHAGMNQDQLLLGGIGQMFGQGAQNRGQDLQMLMPLVQAGLLPPEIVASPGVGSQLTGGLLNAFGSFLGAGGEFGDIFGGGQPAIPGDPFVPEPRAPDFSGMPRF